MRVCKKTRVRKIKLALKMLHKSRRHEHFPGALSHDILETVNSSVDFSGLQLSGNALLPSHYLPTCPSAFRSCVLVNIYFCFQSFYMDAACFNNFNASFAPSSWMKKAVRGIFFPPFFSFPCKFDVCIYIYKHDLLFVFQMLFQLLAKTPFESSCPFPLNSLFPSHTYIYI